MKIAHAHLKSASPMCQGRPVPEKKDRNETHDDFEQRTWMQRAHIGNDGRAFVPPVVFKNCIAEAAKYKSIGIPGKGKSTYTKHFESGILCTEYMPLGVKLDDLEEYRMFVPADGQRGGKKRVWKSFPIFREWEGEMSFHIFDDIITEEVFELHLIDAGQFIGIGSFRARNNGWFGRFSVEELTFT